MELVDTLQGKLPKRLDLMVPVEVEECHEPPLLVNWSWLQIAGAGAAAEGVR
jgi:hypothetical protein